MEQSGTITEQLRALITHSPFGVRFLADFLSLTPAQIKRLAADDLDCLPDDESCRLRIFWKINLLYQNTIEESGQKLQRALGTMLSNYPLSEADIAALSGTTANEVHCLLYDPPKHVSEHAKYQIAVTVMSLLRLLEKQDPIF